MTELLVGGGHVVGPDLSVERADVLLDTGTGRVLDVGDGLGGDDELDARGCLVTPGFVNGHCHSPMTLFRGVGDAKPVGDWLTEDIWPLEAATEAEHVRAGAELAIVEMVRSGTTAFVDMYFDPEEIVAAVDAAGLRTRVGRAAITEGFDDERARWEVDTAIETAERFEDVADGRVTSSVMAHTLTTVDDDALRTLAAAARELDVPLHFHANEDAAHQVDPIVGERGVRPLAHAAELGLLDDGDFVAHAVHVDEEEIALLADRGVGVVHCPASNMKLGSGAAPVRRLLDAGVAVGLGTDGAASNDDLDMVGEMRDAAMLGAVTTGDPRSVDARTAFRMATSLGARAVGLPCGELRPGGVADVAVVDFDAAHLTPVHDHIRSLVFAARGSDVRHVVCDGQVVMRDGVVQTLDESAVRERAREAAADVVRRAEERRGGEQ